MSEPQRPRRPVMRTPPELDNAVGASPDPAELSRAAHESAAVLVGVGRASTDPQVRERVIGLVEELGITTVAQLWSSQPADTLPGALWRVYALREWVQRDPAGAAADYAAGMLHADVAHVVAGAAEPPGPDEVRAVGEAIVRGVFEGDLAVALERAAAFARVVALGRAHLADAHDGQDESAAGGATRSAGSLVGTAEQLQRCATLWRQSRLS